MAFSNFITNVKHLWLGTEDNYLSAIAPILSGTAFPSFDMKNAEGIATLFTCIKILSETLSHLPLNVYLDGGDGKNVNKDDYRYSLLHYNPNNWTSSQTFIACLEYWRSLKGNSFARIYRKNGKVTSLVLIPPSKVVGYGVINDQLYYDIINDNNQKERLNSFDILHFRGITKDGIWGVSNIEALRLNLSTSWQGMNTIDNFYKNNLTSPKAVKSIVNGANMKAQKELVDEWNSKYASSINAGKLVILPPNTEIVDMELQFADAIFIETFKFNAGQIASVYGIPPEMVGLFEASKFNNVEQMQINFKSNTMANIARIYRQEFESKLLTNDERKNGTSIEFNTMALVEMDATTRSNYLKTMSNLGVITPNMVAKIEGYPTYPEGDLHYIPGNYLTIETIAAKKPGAIDTSVNI